MSLFPLPKDEYDLQDAGLEFFRAYWKRPTLILYGKRGDKQHGVDITDQENADNLWVVQCKRHEPTKNLTESEMRGELVKTKSFPQTITKYVFLTTAKKNAYTDDAVITINAERKERGEFLIEVKHWDDVESDLEHLPDVAERILKTSYASVRSVVQNALGDHAIDEDIETAVKLMKRREYTAARSFFEDLRSTKYDRMNRLQRFRCLTNIATIDRENGREASAAALFLKAYDEYPEHEKALANKALAEILLGKHDLAWETAQLAFSANSESPQNAAIYIAFAPKSEDIDRQAEALSSNVRNTPEVLSALANRSLLEKRYEKAIFYARKLKENIEFRSGALYVEARALQESIQPTDPRDDLSSQKDRQTMADVVALYDEAAKIAEKENGWLFAIQYRLFQLDAARHANDMEMLSRVVEAGLALSLIHGHDIAQSRFLMARSQLATQKNDHQSAFVDAKRAVELKETLDLRIIYILSLWNRNQENDRQDACTEMAKILDKLSGHHLEDGLDLVLRGYRANKKWDDAEEAIRVSEINGLDPAIACVYRSHIERLKGNTKEAQKIALDAKSKISENTSVSAKRLISEALAFLGMHKETVEVLEPIASHNLLDEDTRNLLAAAQSAGLDAYFLKRAEELRLSGVEDDLLLSSEVFLLTKYNPSKAIEVIQDGLKWSKNIGHLRIQLAVLGIRLQRPDISRLSITDLPDPDKIQSTYIYSAVECLINSGLHQSAVEYAYKCLHHNPESSGAHAALIRSLLLVKDQSLKLTQPIEVGSNCVVEYCETGTDRITTVVIDDEVPKAFSEIIESNSDVAKHLMGHKVGEEVVLAEGFAQDRTATIKGIYNKYVFRMNACLMSWQLKFPNEPFIQQMRMETDPKTGEIDIGPLFKTLTVAAEQVKNIDQLYKTGAIPITFVGTVLNRSIFDTMDHLAYDGDLFINSSVTTDEVFLSALEELSDAKGLVLDITSLWTLQKIGLIDVIQKIPVPIVISQETMDAVREKVEEFEGGESKQAIRKEGENIQLIETNEEQAKQQQAHWIKVLYIIQKYCNIGSSLALADLDVDRRAKIEKLAGRDGFRSIAAAKDASFILWGEDRVQAVLAMEIFGVKRVWSQAVFAWLKDMGVISATEYLHASIKMQGLRISGIGVQAESLIEAGRLSGWEAGSLLLERNLKVLGEGATLPQNVVVMASRFIQSVKREVSLTANQDALITLTLEEIYKRKDGALLVEALLSLLPRQMPLDPVACAQIQETIRAWLKSKLIW